MYPIKFTSAAAGLFDQLSQSENFSQTLQPTTLHLTSIWKQQLISIPFRTPRLPIASLSAIPFIWPLFLPSAHAALPPISEQEAINVSDVVLHGVVITNKKIGNERKEGDRRCVIVQDYEATVDVDSTTKGTSAKKILIHYSPFTISSADDCKGWVGPESLPILETGVGYKFYLNQAGNDDYYVIPRAEHVWKDGTSSPFR